MFQNLTNRLSAVVKNLTGRARLSEENIDETLREVRIALLEADVGLDVLKDFLAAVRERALGEEVIGTLTPLYWSFSQIGYASALPVSSIMKFPAALVVATQVCMLASSATTATLAAGCSGTGMETPF